MKILVLGGSGHIGQRLLETLAGTSWAIPVGAARNLVKSDTNVSDWIRLDTCDQAGLTAELKGFDAVVNCVAGDARSIAEGTRVLVKSAGSAGCSRIIQLSTMSVYGPVEGLVQEDAPLNPGLGWYGQAKCEAEQHIREFVSQGGKAVMLRPGCVFGPGSELWVGRIARWLRTGRLGDLGIAGDGWSNLVHVDDVCEAIVSALQLPIESGKLPTFNLVAPDSPRWNEYFVDLALALNATPVRRVRRQQLQLDAWLGGPPLKVAQMALKYVGSPQRGLPDPLSPGLLRLWAQHIRLDGERATQSLGMTWTPYEVSLKSCAAWLGGNESYAAIMGNTACTH